MPMKIMFFDIAPAGTY